MELIQVTQELYEASKRLHDGSERIFTIAKEKAVAEKIYRQELQVAIIELKDQKMPVSIIGDIARGMCADAKYSRDLAEARYSSARDSLDAVKVQVSALQTILKYQDEV